jgi:hypothetical protein
MRLVKLGTREFPNQSDPQAFFAQELPSRKPPGLFPCKQIGKNGLQPDETVLFTYRCRLRFVAKAKTGRKNNIYVRQADYPHCFEIDMKSLRRADVPLEEVEHQFRSQSGFQKSRRAQAWTRISGSDQAKQIIDTLLSS